MIIVSAGVSGRHFCDEPVRRLVPDMLRQFRGVCSDEYLAMYEALAEIETGLKDGVRFLRS